MALLGKAQADFVARVDRRLSQTEFCALSLAHSRNVLRYLREGPQRASQIVALCDVSKQALSQQVVHLERNGYVLVAPDPSDQRARLLSLTDKGRRAQALVESVFAEVEQEWGRQYGVENIQMLRDLLTAVAHGSRSPEAGQC